MRLIILLLITAPAFCQDFRSLPPLKPAQAYHNEEAYRVYSALLADAHKPLVIRYDTVGDRSCVDSIRARDQVAASALDDYLKVNLTRWALQDKFSRQNRPKLIGSRDIRAIDEEWQKPRENRSFFTLPGYFVLSAVGFNADKTIAAVWIYYACGGLCGNGHLAVLRKADGVWKETKEDKVCDIVS